MELLANWSQLLRACSGGTVLDVTIIRNDAIVAAVVPELAIVWNFLFELKAEWILDF